MIQDIFPHRFDNRFISGKEINENDYIFHFNGDAILLKEEGEYLSLPKACEFTEISNCANKVFLFALNGVSCFLILGDLKPEKPDFIYKEINFFRLATQQEIAWVSLVAFQLKNWYEQHRYCGKCGSVTQVKSEERAVVCSNCNLVVYPRISPAVIVAIKKGDKLLLAHNANFPENWYSILAGYADVGETLEDTLVREVHEEVGLKIRNIRYYKSQPWPFSGSLMIGFIAEADGDDDINIDNVEIKHADWFTKDNLPDYPSDISIAGEMIELFKRGEL